MSDKISLPFSEFEFSYARSSGAGGQNVNKVNSKVIMYWDIENSVLLPSIKERFKQRYGNLITDDGKVQIIGQEHRSQKMNQDACIDKLYEMIAKVRFPPKVRKPTKPKRSAVLKRLETKKKDSEKKRLRKSDY